MEDYLVKALCYEGSIRAYAVCATNTISEAQKRHDTWSSSTAALGRTMVGALLLGATLKGEDKLTVKVQGNGPAGSIVVDSDGSGNTKGYIKNPHVSLTLNESGKIDVRGAVGTEGIFTVIKDLGLKETFSGQTPIVSGEIGEDFTYFMAVSEQIPSAIGLSVLVDTDESVKAAGGFMIQVMPGADEKTIDFIEQRLQEVPMISRLIDEGESPEGILERLLGKDQIEILEKMPVQFNCNCSKEKFGTAIIAVGLDEINAMIEEDHGAEAVCQFCGNKYHYSEDDLIELRDEAIKNTREK
ncbi:Hsp33 family molecular chaperone [Enterococcus plantarum]|uniref:33 kDa chaperonin n=1 Tax=Enterococcus plantarum TaxID=1077675 RepID=A0A2W3Z4B7_9ENTE|nr:Hsp33 family molecular chaperone HslO [Enterococcus plantarum]MBO0421706.1 Hsp33 family molecular chaperone HslO [Enterococcus plantarum]OEG11255.1 Hsp33 family molecular chaperone [Enterococcus plantarum]PZL74968.1 Hsp33 family molecular chaperone HslO [Enterococcus plantarum]